MIARFVEFENLNGSPISIQSANVAAISPSKQVGQTEIVLPSGVVIVVKATYMEAKKKLEQWAQVQ